MLGGGFIIRTHHYYIGIRENKMETTIVCRGYIGGYGGGVYKGYIGGYRRAKPAVQKRFGRLCDLLEGLGCPWAHSV